jgi:hypothetical protein
VQKPTPIHPKKIRAISNDVLDLTREEIRFRDNPFPFSKPCRKEAAMDKNRFGNIVNKAVNVAYTRNIGTAWGGSLGAKSWKRTGGRSEDTRAIGEGYVITAPMPPLEELEGEETNNTLPPKEAA